MATLTPDHIEQLATAMKALANVRRQADALVSQIRVHLPDFERDADTKSKKATTKATSGAQELPLATGGLAGPPASHGVVALLRDEGPLELVEIVSLFQRRWPELRFKDDTIRAAVYRRANWFEKRGEVYCLTGQEPAELQKPFGGATP